MQLNSKTLVFHNLSEEEIKGNSKDIDEKGNIPAMLFAIMHNQAIIFDKIQQLETKIDGLNEDVEDLE